MPSPHEIVAAPLTLWLAPTGTAFPAVQTAPAVDFNKLGTEGPYNYDEDGVTLNQSQSIETFIPAGSPRPRKAWRTEEGLAMSLVLVDLTPEQHALILDRATVTTVAAAAGTAGTKSFSRARGIDVAQYALLARGPSSVNNALTYQHEWPTVFQSGEPEEVWSKGKPVGLAVEFTALEVTPGAFGTTRVQTAAPTS